MGIRDIPGVIDSGSSSNQSLQNTINNVNQTVSNDLRDTSDNIKNSVQQISQQMDSLAQVISGVKDKLSVNDLKPNLKKQVDDLQEYANNIKNIMHDINSISGNSININLGIDSQQAQNVQILQDKIDGLISKVFQIQDVTKNLQGMGNIPNDLKAMTDGINSALSSLHSGHGLENIVDTLQNVSKSISEVKDQVSTPMSANMTQGLQRDLEAALKAILGFGEGARTTKQNVEEFKESVKFAQLDSQLEPLKYAELGFRNLMTDLQGLSKSFNASQDAVAAFFNTLQTNNVATDAVNKSMSELYSTIHSMPNALNQMRGVLDTKEDILGIVKNSEKLEQEFNKFDETVNQTIEKVKNTMSTTINSLPNESRILGAAEPIVSSYKKEIESAARFMQDLLNEINKNGSTDETTDRIKASLKNRLSSFEQYYTELDTLNQKKSQAFSSELSDALDPTSAFGKQINYQIGSRSYDSFSHAMGSTSRGAESIGHLASSAQHHMDSGFMNVSFGQRAKTNSSVDLDKIGEKAKEIEKITAVYNNAEANFKQAFSKAASGNPEDVKEAQDRLKDLIKISEELSHSAVGFGSLIKIYNKKDMQELPDEVKKVILAVDQEVKNIGSQNHDIFDLAQLVDKDGAEEAVKNLKKVDKEVDALANRFDVASGKSKGLFKSLKDEIGNIFSPLSGLSKAFGVMGLGALPLSLGGLANYASGTFDQYNDLGTQRAQTTRADFGMGNAIDPNAAQFRLVQQGMAYSKMTGGIIGMNEYNNSYNNLAQNVGGRYGSNDIESLRDLNEINDKTFGLSKLYNISDSTMAQAVNTFYKDLRMSASDASDTINRLTQTAISANVPVDKYVRLVSQLAANFRNIGLSGNTAIDITANMMARGLNVEDATQFASDVGRGMTSMADNWGLTAFNGIMSGQASDPFQAIARGQNRFNADGNANPDFAQYMAANMDNWMNTIGMATGGDKNAQYSFLIKSLKDQGFTHKDAELATEAYMTGDTKFFQETISKGTAQEQQLTSQEEINRKLGTIGEQLTPLQRTLNELTIEQRNLASSMKGTFDGFFSQIEKTLFNMINQLNGMTTSLVGALNNFTNSPLWNNVASPYLNSLEQNPLLVGGLTLGGIYGAKLLGKKAVGAGIKNIFGPKNAQTGAKVAEEAVEAEAKAAEEVAQAAQKGAPDYLKVAKKGGKAAIFALGAAGLAYGGYSLFNNKGNQTSSPDGLDYNTGSIYDSAVMNANSGNNMYAMNMYDKVSGIHDMMRTSTTGGIYTPYTATPSNPYYVGSAGGYAPGTTSTNPYNQYTGTAPQTGYKSMSVPSILDNAPSDSLVEIAGLGAFSMFGDSLITKAVNKAAGGVAAKTAEQTALKTGEKVVAETGLKAGTKALTSVGGSLLVDAAFNYYDPVKNAVQGNGVGSDWGKGSAGFATDASFTLAGAGIGTLVAPGVGTIIGAILGGLVEAGISLATVDPKTGKSAIDDTKEDLTISLTGRTSEDIEIERMLKNGTSNEFLLQNFQKLGINKESAQVMVEALNKHSSELKGLNDDEKFAWAARFADLRQQGVTESQAINELKKELKDGSLVTVMDQLKTTIANSMGVSKEDYDTAARKAVDNVKKVDNVAQGKDGETGVELRNPVQDSLYRTLDPTGLFNLNPDKVMTPNGSMPRDFVEKNKANKAGADAVVANEEYHILHDGQGRQIRVTTEQLNRYKLMGQQINNQSLQDMLNDPMGKNKKPTPFFVNPDSNKTAMFTETIHGSGDINNDVKRWGSYGNIPTTSYNYSLPADVLEKIRKENEEADAKKSEQDKLNAEKSYKLGEDQLNTQKQMLDKLSNGYPSTSPYGSSVPSYGMPSDIAAILSIPSQYASYNGAPPYWPGAGSTGTTAGTTTAGYSSGSSSGYSSLMGMPTNIRDAVIANAATRGNLYSGSGSANLGALSLKYESSGDPGSVNFNDTKGSHAFGLYQLNDKYGQLDDFVQYLGQANPQMYKQLAGLDLHSNEFAGAWKNIAAADPTAFGNLQQDFIKKEYYDKAAGMIQRNLGLDLNSRSSALKQVIWSTSVQHGQDGALRGMRNALGGRNPNSVSDADLINAIYSWRSSQGNTDPARFAAERQDALAALGNANGFVYDGKGFSGSGSSYGSGTSSYSGSGNDAYFAQIQSMMGNSGVFGTGMLSASVLSKDALARMYTSSYSTGDSKSTTNYLGMMKDLLNAGGDSVYTSNNQAMAKQLRMEADKKLQSQAASSGSSYYDRFGATVKPDYSSIYKPYDSGANYNIPEGVSVSKDGKNVIIGINVGSNSDESHVSDAKTTAKEVALLFESKGYTAKIQEMDGKIESLADFIHYLAKDANNTKMAQYG